MDDKYLMMNGFIDMKRDVVVGLIKLVKNPLKVRMVMGMCKEIYEWKSHSSFLKTRKKNLGVFIKFTEECDYMFKIILVGDASVGKTEIVLRFVENVVNPNFLAPIGSAALVKRNVQFDDKIICAHVWDPNRHNTFLGLPIFYRGVGGALLIYDVTNRSTFEELPHTLKELREMSRPMTPSDPSRPVIVLVGNKCDMSAHRKVTTREGRKFAEKNGMYFFETSAIQGTNVKVAFNTILQELYLRNVRPSKGEEGSQNKNVRLSEGSRKKSSGCF